MLCFVERKPSTHRLPGPLCCRGASVVTCADGTHQSRHKSAVLMTQALRLPWTAEPQQIPRTHFQPGREKLGKKSCSFSVMLLLSDANAPQPRSPGLARWGAFPSPHRVPPSSPHLLQTLGRGGGQVQGSAKRRGLKPVALATPLSRWLLTCNMGLKTVPSQCRGSKKGSDAGHCPRHTDHRWPPPNLVPVSLIPSPSNACARTPAPPNSKQLEKQEALNLAFLRPSEGRRPPEPPSVLEAPEGRTPHFSHVTYNGIVIFRR